MFQNVFDCAAVIVISITAAVFVALVILGDGARTTNIAQADLFQVTVIHKNQRYPRIGEVEARAAQTDTKDEANGGHGIGLGRHGQWI